MAGRAYRSSIIASKSQVMLPYGVTALLTDALCPGQLGWRCGRTWMLSIAFCMCSVLAQVYDKYAVAPPLRSECDCISAVDNPQN